MTAPDAAAPRFTALVLAADRGAGDPVSRAAGVAHKCLAPVAGRAMLDRVVAALAASPHVGRIAISLRDPALAGQVAALAPLLESGRLVPLQAAETPSRSVLKAAAELDQLYPLLVTTADHALLTTQMVDYFCGKSVTSGAEVTAGLTASQVLLAGYPQSRRTYLRFRDEHYSGSNLFALLAAGSLKAVEVWLRAEQQRKRPWRIAAVFGPALLLGYLLRRYSLDEALDRISERLGMKIAAVKMPFAEAAIDVDKPEDLELAEKILGKG
ncbi:MAG: NTP transferase domain-containing protein [Kiloniellaceae bacterium]